jgi:hypothetical protein
MPSIFVELCDILDDLDQYIFAMPSGPERDKLELLRIRLDEVVERTVGLDDVPMTTE